MAFLDYLLGGVSGGFEGYERKKANELKAKQDEEERQIRLASLFSQGFEPVADVQRKKQAAVGAAGSMAMTALNSVLGGAPRAVPSMADQEALMQGYATAKPERAITAGGQQLALRETAAERQERQARADDMQRRRDAASAAEAARKAREAEDMKKDERIARMVDAARKGGRRSQAAILLAAEDRNAYNALFPEIQSGGGLTAGQRLEQEQKLANAEARYNLGERDPQKRAEIGATFQRLRAANPKASPREILLATFNAVDQKEALRYKEAQTGKLESSSVNPMADLLGATPADDPALEEERRAYDEAVKKYGMEYVRSRGFVRP